MINFNKKPDICIKKVISSHISKESRRIKKVTKSNIVFLKSLGFKTI